MVVIQGNAGAPGIAAGRVLVKRARAAAIVRNGVADREREIARLEAARRECIAQTTQMYEYTLREIGEQEAAIFKAHRLMLQDDEFFAEVAAAIRADGVNAEWALQEAEGRLTGLFAGMETAYLQERAADVRDVVQSVIDRLLGEGDAWPETPDQGPLILAAHDLTPSDTLKLDKGSLAGLLTEVGGTTSHTVILAKTLGIPAITGISRLLERVPHGATLMMDGTAGAVYLDPEPRVREELLARKAAQERRQRAAAVVARQAAFTRDGRRIRVCGNLGDLEECDAILQNGGEGIGLYRTEFLYMGHSDYPSEAEQFAAYQTIARKLQGNEVVIRTLDIGGDKKLSYLELPREDNPFLGYRAIRIGLNEPELLLTQLQAILRASAFGNVKIMFPMIVTLEELLQAKRLVAEAGRQLRREGAAFNERIPVGIMIETPAAAVMARALAREADFFSIGSNDLIQYVTAADRLNAKVQYLYDPRNLAVLRLIRQVADAAHAAGIPVSVCGEMASDEKLLPLLVGMGIDKFSATPNAIPRLKLAIGRLNAGELRPAAEQILECSLIDEVERGLAALHAQYLEDDVAEQC
ncbi:phosphotransferase system enzyme I (PtsI) [Hydrogenispora ethanolica]|jgi:phosphotransferase system enzyme I (PtsI)|uniref:Phosphoenolpyruvate-protein phosphotransferase n=1 Tax=Hydrogenispora ethanolica TaxID=1082276 RepID=A0A4R1SAB9_HYDET|nr:phosphoenolpyruvate--protein phosphotransferase [Hydrogenispora ethanolica]TCL76456.1 phosphotransferase system enzyme I (PtsI) [Hydrogenispora ethanolica]